MQFFFSFFSSHFLPAMICYFVYAQPRHASIDKIDVQNLVYPLDAESVAIGYGLRICSICIPPMPFSLTLRFFFIFLPVLIYNYFMQLSFHGLTLARSINLDTYC